MNTSSCKRKGIVLAFIRYRHFGYIEDSETKFNHWFHMVDVPSRKTPTVGQRVTFEIALDVKGREKAVNVAEVSPSPAITAKSEAV